MVDSYPNYKPNNISETVDVWHMMLSEYDYKSIAMALKAYILTDTSGFAPAIGQIISKLYDIHNPNQMSETEAWSLVKNAMSNSGYNCLEEYNKLPKIVQKCIGEPIQLRKWAMTENLNESVVSSNFIKAYKEALQKEKINSMYTQDIKKMIDSSNGMMIEKSEN